MTRSHLTRKVVRKTTALLVLGFLASLNMAAQCFVENLSPTSFSFTESGGTQTNSIVYSNGSCSQSLSFSNIPVWVTSVTQTNSYQITVVCQANGGGSRTELITFSYDGNIGSFAISQDPNTTPPSAPGDPTVSDNGCGQATLTKSGTSTNGVTWYWQGKNLSGTSTLNNATAPYTVNDGTGGNGTYYIRARSTNGQWSTSSGSRYVGVIDLSGGVIMNVPTVCYGADPDTLGSFEDAGGISGSFSYQWQASSVSATSGWADLPGETSTTYNPPSNAITSKWYRRKVSCSLKTEYTNVIKVTVRPNLLPGSIAGTGPICYNTSPGGVTNVSPASGGDDTLFYQWQYSDSGSAPWTDIANSGQSSYYPSGALSASRWYRREVSSCGQVVYTAPVLVTVNPEVLGATGANVSRCGTGSVTLNASPGSNANGISWYTGPSGGTALTAGVSGNTLSYTTGAISADTTFYAESFNSVTGCKATTRSPIQAQVTTTITWFLDADNDGHAVSSVVSCASPGAAYTQTVLPIDDCNDGDFAIQESKIWYSDTDGDGFGDPNSPSAPTCIAPQDHVSDNTDCDDTAYSPQNDCTSVPPSSDPSDHNYVYTRNYQRSADEMIAEENIDQNNFEFFTPSDGVVQQITYFDGLGRPVQQVGIDQSPDENADFGDIVTFMDYDAYGRMGKEYLPYATTAGALGSYRTNAEADTETYYKLQYPNDIDALAPNPYSEKYFEPSPLNRVLKQGAPGDAWALAKDANGNLLPNADDHSIGFTYASNTHDPSDPTHTANDNVRLFQVITAFADNTYSPTLVYGDYGNGDPVGYYAQNELYKNSTRDENHTATSGKNHTTEEFTDKQGRVLLKRTYGPFDADDNGTIETNETELPFDTYYVYDDFGNLTYVLPPKMEASTASLAEVITNLPDLGYQYIYDHRNRLVEKRIPGKKKEYIIYNKLDQPVLTQDGNQRSKDPNTDEWLFTKYDVFGRVAYTGKASSSEGMSREEIQSQVNALTIDLWVTQRNTAINFGGTDVLYDNGGYPGSAVTNPKATLAEILTVNYYDRYDYRPAGAPLSVVLLGTTTNELNTTDVKGLATGSKVKVLDNDDATNEWITSLTYYDNKARPVYSYSKNEYLKTVDIVETQLDFIGKPLKTKTTHRRDTDSNLGGDEVVLVTIDNFRYDPVGRLLAQTQCIGDETMGDSCPVDASLDATIVWDNQGNITSDLEATGSIILRNTTVLPGPDGVTLRITDGSEQELIAFNRYDALGQLNSKKVGGSPASDYSASSGLQEVNYSYNVRGWLTDINEASNTGPDKLFNFNIGYTNPQNGATPLYNGNISETQWRTANTDSALKSYSYAYDPLNRITAAIGGANSNYDVTGIGYDKNGNIGKLNRRGNDAVSPTSPNYDVIDNLDYQYGPGNKLLSVTDAQTGVFGSQGFKDGNQSGNDYVYDPNGNMTQDLNKGIKGAIPTEKGITYNHLNLPVTVNINSTEHTGTISYIYDATGVKLQKNVLKNGVETPTDYAGNYVYEGGKLQFFGQDEGYVMPRDVDDYSAGFEYVYNYLDHLGNIRLSYTDANGDGDITTNEIVKESNYYPFGLAHQGYNNNVSPLGNSNAKKYMFGGKELDESLGLDNYDYGARNYDPALGRWMNVDPLADQMRRHSPYNYAFDNPVSFVDVDGREPIPWYRRWYGPKREASQWYGSFGIYDRETFHSAAVYNTQKQIASAYQSVYQRNSYYGWVQQQADAKGLNSKWFGAAELVTGIRGVGGSEMQDFNLASSSAVDAFLSGGNEFLFAHNMKNAKALLSDGNISGSFTDANNKEQSFEGLSGVNLDNKLVEFEQSKVQEYIDNYPFDDLNEVMDGINEMMNGQLPSSEIQDIIKQQFNKEFDFSNYKHRVQLGQELIKNSHDK